jgi:hypothetical protein
MPKVMKRQGRYSNDRQNTYLQVLHGIVVGFQIRHSNSFYSHVVTVMAGDANIYFRQICHPERPYQNPYRSELLLSRYTKLQACEGANVGYFFPVVSGIVLRRIMSCLIFSLRI